MGRIRDPAPGPGQGEFLPLGPCSASHARRAFLGSSERSHTAQRTGVGLRRAWRSGMYFPCRTGETETTETGRPPQTHEPAHCERCWRCAPRAAEYKKRRGGRCSVAPSGKSVGERCSAGVGSSDMLPCLQVLLLWCALVLSIPLRLVARVMAVTIYFFHPSVRGWRPSPHDQHISSFSRVYRGTTKKRPGKPGRVRTDEVGSLSSLLTKSELAARSKSPAPRRKERSGPKRRWHARGFDFSATAEPAATP